MESAADFVTRILEGSAYRFTVNVPEAGHVMVELDYGGDGFYGRYAGMLFGRKVSGACEYANDGLFEMDPIKGLTDKQMNIVSDTIDAHPMMNEVSAAYYREFGDESEG